MMRGMRRYLSTLCALVLALSSAASAGAQQDLRVLVGATFPARVVTVLDGDTIDVMRPGHKAPLRIRLEGIDTPERGEPFSQVALRRTRVLVFDQNVSVEGRDVDRYDRLVARVIVGSGAARTDASVALVSDGLACHYRQYSSDPALARAEADARAAGRGFWARDAQKPRCVTNPSGTSDAEPVEKGAAVAPMPLLGTAAPTPGAVIGNTRSRVFHLPTCPNANCPNCTRRFSSRTAAEGAGFRPAGDCIRGR